MNIRICLFSILLSASLTSINAATLDDVLGSIANNNIELKKLEASQKSQIAEIKTSNNLEDTQLEFEYQKGDNVDGNKHGFGISQGFDWPGMYIERAKSNKSLINAAGHEYSAQRLNILLNAKQVCLKIINSNRKIQAQTEVYNNIAQLSTEYDKGFKHGEISILDINKLKIELLNVKQTLDRTKTERAMLIEELTALNGNQPIAGIESINSYPEQSLESIETYKSQLAADPENMLNSTLIESSKSNVTMAKMGWFPKFAIGYKYANELGDKFNGLTLGMSLPLFSNKNKVNVAKAELIAAEYNQMNISTDKSAKLHADYSQAVNLKSQIHAYNNVLSDSSNKEMLKKALDGGQITLLNYLLELRYFLEAQQTLLDLEFEYNSTLANLNRYSLL